MHINLEQHDQFTIQSYSDHEVKIADEIYQDNLIVSPQEILQPWAIKTINELKIENLEPFLKSQPKIIIIGHNALKHPPMEILQYLSTLKIGMEAMSIGAACRTFNVLLSEGRDVVLGLLLN